MHPRHTLAAGALALLAAFPAAAQTEPQGEAVVVTATRQPVRANELLNDVAVITRDDIEKAGPLQTLGELLTQTGGVEFSNAGGRGSATSVYLRGANAGHTLVLIDGQRVGSATLGTASIENIPLAQIERVEILKGSASALYGSDAIGGVIQVFTKRGEGPARVYGDIGYGTYGTTEANAGLSGQSGAWRYSVRVGGIDSDGFNAIGNSKSPAFNKDDDGYQNLNASAKLSLDLAPGHEIGLQTFYSRNKSEYDSSYYDAAWKQKADYNFRSTSTVESFAAYSKNRFTSNWTSLVRVGRSVDDSQSHSSPTKRDDFKTNQDQFVWQNDIRLPVGSLLLAAESLRQSIVSSNTYAEDARTTNSLLAGWNGSFGKHRLQANVRGDDDSQFGHKNTGGAAYGYQFSDAWRARAAFSTGFKAPTFNDLYFPDDPFMGGGNPKLKPEESRNREIGLNYETASTSVAFTLYRNDVDNLIAWAPVDPNNMWGDWLPYNIGKARLEGGTLSGKHRIGNVTLRASLDLQNPKDRETGNFLTHRARQHGSLGFDHVYGRLTWGGDVIASGMRYNDAANTQELGGYATVNLRADYRLEKDLSLFARVGNLFDKDYELKRDYETPGRTVFVGIRYQPK